MSKATFADVAYYEGVVKPLEDELAAAKERELVLVEALERAKEELTLHFTLYGIDWEKDIFGVCLIGGEFKFTCVYEAWNECHPLATHSHLVGTTYPADTPACAKCGKSAPDCVCANGKPTATTVDGVTEQLDAITAERDALRAELDALMATTPQAHPGGLQPFQRVLVRDWENQTWQCDLYSHFDLEADTHVCAGAPWNHVLPYDGNAHLLGTTDSPA